MAKKPCRIHYRKLVRNNGSFPELPLHERISAALNAAAPDGSQIRSRVGNRVAASPNQPGYQRMLNNYQIENDYVFGTTCLFAPVKCRPCFGLTETKNRQISRQS